MGVVNLEEEYPLSSLAQITDLLLLSWAGLTLCKYEMDEQLADGMAHATRELEEAGVRDKDIREANFVWNEELKRVVRIDLGEAKLDPALALPTGPSGNKRQMVEDVSYEPRKRQVTGSPY